MKLTYMQRQEAALKYKSGEEHMSRLQKNTG